MALLKDQVARSRRKARLTQAALAKRVGTSREWVAAVELGNIRQPPPDKLARLSAELGLDYRELLAITDQLGAVEQPHGLKDDENGRVVAINALAEAIRAQTEAMQAIAREMGETREKQKGRDEALAVSLDALAEQLAALRPVLAGKSR